MSANTPRIAHHSASEPSDELAPGREPSGRAVRVVFLDALGTLVGLEPPAPRLAAALRERGLDVGEDVAGAALAAEMAYYREHHHEARDLETLADLRGRCTAVLQRHLPERVPDLHDVLMASLAFTPFPEVEAALAALRAAGPRLVVVSNWDVSLHEALMTTGLTRQVDAALSSAEAGAAKPDPAIFARALALAGEGLTPDDAIHVGDEPVDVLGARAAGIRSVLIHRDPSAPPDPEVAAQALAVLPDLSGLPSLILP